MRYLRVLLVGCLVCTESPSRALEMVSENIGPYKWEGATYPAVGILTGSGRLGDAADEHVKTAYRDRERRIGVRVSASSYADPTWVLHEFTGGSCGGSTDFVNESGRRRFESATVAPETTEGDVSWASGDTTLVLVEFTLAGPDRPVELPTEVINAYLALYPSSLGESLANASEHCRTWVPNEMRRILEYGVRDLGFARMVPTDPARSLSRGFWRDQVIRWLTEFADLRARFYGVGKVDALKEELLRAQIADIDPDTQRPDLENDLDRLEAKLNEFQEWWTAHQNDPVQLPTPEAAPATSPSPAPTP
jgi:hypothetical protein